jgi:thiol-disulfide isomerase/thioredoxin
MRTLRASAVLLLVVLAAAALAAATSPTTAASSARTTTSASAATPPPVPDPPEGVGAGPARPSALRRLDDSNFEKETQAATGSTTGDWFVCFVSEACYLCPQLRPTWEAVATELQGRVNVAEVDGDYNRGTARRFNVTKYPTILLIRRGSYYPYDDFRTVRPLVEFATGRYTNVKAVPVKPEPTLWSGPERPVRRSFCACAPDAAGRGMQGPCAGQV